jgi:hypothetical protein
MNNNMKNNTTPDAIEKRVFAAIAEGRVRMRPRWHFFLRTALGAVGGIIVLLLVVYIMSFTIFSLRQSGIWFMPSFGSRGWITFLFSLPWVLIGLAGLFVVLLEIMVRRYSFGYRQPLLYTVIGIVAVVVVCSAIVAQTTFHRRVLQFTQQHPVPLAPRLYRGYGQPYIRDVHKGFISNVVPGGFDVTLIEGDMVRIIIMPFTRFPRGIDIAEGDTVVIFGRVASATIEALGIRKVDADFDISALPRRGRGLQFLVPPTDTATSGDSEMKEKSL